VLKRKGTLTLRRDDGRIVCESVTVADTYFRRLGGLLGRSRLDSNQGLVLRPSFSIHTWFMRFPIDVVYVDADQVVIKIAESLRPFRTSSARGAREVVELAAGECARRGLTVGDRVAWASQAPVQASLALLSDAPAPDVDEVVPIGRALIASRDARFVKLARFLLDGKGVETATAVQPDRLAATLELDDDVNVVLLDAQEAVATTLATANAARAARPEVPIIVVGEPQAAERAPAGVRIYDKWNETDELIAEVERLLAADAADPDMPPVGQSV
jgi:uncharacterized protein